MQDPNSDDESLGALSQIVRTIETLRRAANPLGNSIAGLLRPAQHVAAALEPWRGVMKSEAFRIQAQAVVSEVARPLNLDFARSGLNGRWEALRALA